MFLTLSELRDFVPTKDAYFVFGYPISHSLSPKLHENFFKGSGISADYFAVEIDKPQLQEAISIVKAYAKGVNLTIPLKECVIPMLSEIDPVAGKIGAVNTLKFEGDKIIGYNTDYYGLTSSVDLKDKDVLILGNGGAARAFLQAGLDFGKSVTVCGRDYGRVSEFCKNTSAVPTTYDKLSVEDGVVILNASPLGMGKLITQTPVRENIIKRASFVFDSIYNPKKTNLLVLAEIYNKKAINGISMLIYQGVKAQEIWGNRGSSELSDFSDEKRIENIILTGFMGSGKTTVGRLLAEKTDRLFFDIDSVLEDVHSMKITEIFEKYGEEYFRKEETEICRKISSLNGCIIATGGGIIKNSENITALKSGGKIYFINPDLSEIGKRLESDTTRPLIQKKENIEKLYNERIGIYKKTADFIISENSSENAAEEVMKRNEEIF